MIIYADILFVLNAYVTYTLLLVTDLISRKNGKRLRRTLAALLGGIYAFVIFLPHLPRLVLFISRLAAAAVYVAVAYGKGSRKRFFLLYAVFFGVNFAFAGLMFAIVWTLHPKSMRVFGSVVYFDIDVLLLAVMTVLCYGFFYALRLLLDARKPARAICRLTVTLNGKSISCNALCDTGNSAVEPFSGLPVIFIESSTLQTLTSGIDFSDPQAAQSLHLRQIPCEGVCGEAVLTGIRPDSVTVCANERVIQTKDVYLALCDARLGGGDFSALLHPNLTEEMNVILCEDSNDY